MHQKFNFFVTCAKNLEGLLEDELKAMGITALKQTVAGVQFVGDLADAYRVCLWSRLANRVLLQLGSCNAEDATALYEGIKKIDWQEHLSLSESFAVDFSGSSRAINNTHFGALRVKDGIADKFMQLYGSRPNVNTEDPDLRINVHLYSGEATVSLDLSGASLHRRGYRCIPGPAPLKETLAAAILYRLGWPELAQQGYSLVDPMCGSGTILVEAAMMIQDYAPGLLRAKFGFDRWLQHDIPLWQSLLNEAQDRFRVGAERQTVRIHGSDKDAAVLHSARSIIQRAKLNQVIDLAVSEVKEITPALYGETSPGIIVTNPPYGKRLLQDQELVSVYQDFGLALRQGFLGWKLAVFSGNHELCKELYLRPSKRYNFFNGTLPCRLLIFDICRENFWREVSSA